MSRSTLLEQFVARLNGNVFLREFAFSAAEVMLPGVGNVEIADHLVILDDHALIFQLKERDAGASRSAAAVEAWFDNKVRKKAVGQLRSTLRYLRDHAGTEVQNDRGHRVPLPSPEREELSALVVYSRPTDVNVQLPKGYTSQRAGFVHFVPDYDYFGVCQVLITPTEIIDYLRFRESVLERFPNEAGSVSEAALVCQFMLDQVGTPDEKYAAALSALKENPAEWDISYITQRMGDQIIYRKGDPSDTSHYRILAELGKLSRSELRALKERLVLCLDAVEADRFELPYRFAIPRTDCGFLLLPIIAEHHHSAESGLTNLTLASKYELKTSKQVGLAVLKSGEYRDLLWVFAESPHIPNPEIDRALAENYPFRKTRDVMIPRYNFVRNELGSLADETGSET